MFLHSVEYSLCVYFRINSTPACGWRQIRCHTVPAVCFLILIPREIVKLFWDCLIIASPATKICYYMDSFTTTFPGMRFSKDWSVLAEDSNFYKSLALYLPANKSVLSAQDNQKTKPNCNLFWWYHIYCVSPYLVHPDCISYRCSYQILYTQSIYRPRLSILFVSMVATTKVWLNSWETFMLSTTSFLKGSNCQPFLRVIRAHTVAIHSIALAKIFSQNSPLIVLVGLGRQFSHSVSCLPLITQKPLGFFCGTVR